ncbi:MAG: hypothetical protein NWS40_08660 [Crocinitomicaceae bacterium]|nr:hypothetical protein [Crocinitomicaceae bacterium]MDP4684746.1 hypothetical protein [Crocinitomicaceae bacterium]MDP4865757.1 hypothetical protein [Crocinitomicaceae bacterium]MDP5010593.1 hypothetical protein [Crocinitomicaceae bacterium]MDP5098962.1 hypothetical protein [Crocinitomicaceae bacterium]
MKTQTSNFSIVNEFHVDNILRSILYENGIIEIVWDTNIELIEVPHLKHAQKAIAVLGNGNKMPIFFTAHEFLAVSKDGSVFAASTEGVKYTLANAVLIDSLPKKILFNFFLNFNRPIAPTKGFTNREDAFSWLLLSSINPE